MRSEIEHGLERQAHTRSSPVASARGRDAGWEHPASVAGLGQRARTIRFRLSQLARVTSWHEFAGACKLKPADVGGGH